MDITKKKIVVTGGGGFVGSFVIKNLIARGVPEQNIVVPRRAEYDLRLREDCMRALAGQDIVIHLAAITGGMEFHKNNPGSIFYDNLIMGTELIDAAYKSGVEKFVGIGSATEYPSSAPMPFKEEDIWNGLPDEVHIPYSMAKKMLMVQGDSYRAQFGFNAIHLLPTNMYGPGEDLKNKFVIPMLIQRFEEAKQENKDFIEVWGSGVAKREFLYVEDAAEGIVLATEKYDKEDPVNLGSGEEISIKDLTEAIANIIGYKGEIRWDKSKPDGQLRRFLGTKKAHNEFGFQAKIAMAEGLKRTIDWYHKT